jgi:hypothetical protein
MQTNDFIVDEQGNFRFTKIGLANQSGLLAKANIRPGDIKTYKQYIQAREACSPYFLENLREEFGQQLEGKPDTLEWQAIRSIVFGSSEERDALIAKVKRKQSFKIV